MTASVWVLIAIVVWGMLVGLDLVSVPQGLLSHPLVAGTVAGLIGGNVAAGLVAGAVLELYALEVLPIGATRYPDFGVAAVAAGLAATGFRPAIWPAMAGLVGLPCALLGGWSLHLLHRRNALSVQRRLERVSHGDARAIWELQRNGLLRDAARSLALILISLLFAYLVTLLPLRGHSRAYWVSWAALAGGITAAMSGALRAAGGGTRRRWLAVGLATGIIVVCLR